MSYKIKTSDTNDITLEVKERKDELWLNIYKTVFSERYTGIAKDSALAFNLDQAKELDKITQTIDPGKYEIKEYGTFHKWSRIFKVFISSFRGINSFQIRERVESGTYTGFGKQWISLPTHKIKELQEHLPKLIQEFSGVKVEGKPIVVVPKKSTKKENNAEIDSYF